MSIDANGILNVTAKDKATGSEQKVEIKVSSGLDKHDVERMVRDASAHEAEDKARSELVELRNRADQHGYQTENFIREQKADIPAEMRSEAQNAIEELRKVRNHHPDDRANVEAALSKLEAVDRRISDEVYKKASKAGAGADQPAGEGARTGRASSTRESNKPDDVIDADYKVVDETKPDA